VALRPRDGGGRGMRAPAARALPLGSVQLAGGEFDRRRAVNRDYLLSLTTANLLQNHDLEAGFWDRAWQLQPSSDDPATRGVGRHAGWEFPTGQLRGHFVGHWLSAAAREAAVTGDAVLTARVGEVLDGLERCQAANGGEWVFGIPPRYLDLLAAGREVWAPQYTMHKTLMGLVDVARDLGDPRALRIAQRAAQWVARWSATFAPEKWDDILDVETGGMLEVWADLLELTGDGMFAELLHRYDHRRLFEPLLAGEDVLTNRHANTTIPEVLGAARAYEVTGDQRWADIVRAYWRCAVTDRGTFCTGGQTSGEIWTPPHAFAARRGDKTQEHCTVYNMIRLADVLYRWDGEPAYLDYIERNLHNGILAQQHPRTGMVTYFLPLHAGARKTWGSPLEDFWCCHGTLVQAHTRHSALAFYAQDDALVLAQYVPARAEVPHAGGTLRVTLTGSETAARVGPDANAGEAGARHRPDSWGFSLVVESPPDAVATVLLRRPDWCDGDPVVVGEEGQDAGVVARPDGHLELTHQGGRAAYEITLPMRLHTLAIPDEPATVAFARGPVVLAGLIDHEVRLRGDARHPDALLVADNERQWTQWLSGYRTVGQERSIRFLPLSEIVDEPYTVYFPLHPD